MPTSIISSVSRDPSGTPVGGVAVIARLRPAPGFRVDDASLVTPTERTVSDGAGAWSLTLEETANITPAGSYWSIEEVLPDSAGGPVLYAITVGAGDATLAASLLNGPPPDRGVANYITQDTGDQRYALIGGGGAHPDLAAHDTLGLATQAELDAVAAAKANASHSHVDADLPAGIARDSEVTAAVTAHEGAANPHPGYLTPAEGDAAYQPLHADLTTIAGLDSAQAGVVASEGAGWLRRTYAQIKTSLGLVKADVGLGNVDNTSDADKPVSTAQATADAAKIDKATLDANSVLIATADDTPIALSMAASTILARLAAGNIVAATPAQLRTLLALVVGTDVQAWDAELSAIATLASAADKGIHFTGSGAASLHDQTAFARSLLAAADALAARSTLSAAPQVRRYKSGRYYGNDVFEGPTGVGLAADQLHFVPVQFDRAVTLDRIVADVTFAAAGSSLRLGVYADDDTFPGARILDAGTVSSATTGVKELAITQAVSAGLHWFALAAQGGAPSVRGAFGYRGSGLMSYAALPASLTQFGTHVQTGVSGALPESAAPTVVGSFVLSLVFRTA